MSAGDPKCLNCDGWGCRSCLSLYGEQGLDVTELREIRLRQRIRELEADCTRRAQSEAELRGRLDLALALVGQRDKLIIRVEGQLSEARTERDLCKAALERSLASELKLVGDREALATEAARLRDGIAIAIATGESMEATPSKVLVAVLRNLRETRDQVTP